MTKICQPPSPLLSIALVLLWPVQLSHLRLAFCKDTLRLFTHSLLTWNLIEFTSHLCKRKIHVSVQMAWMSNPHHRKK